MDRETIERCAKVADLYSDIGNKLAKEYLAGSNVVPTELAARNRAGRIIAQNIRALPSEPPASHTIITKLIGYADHPKTCGSWARSSIHRNDDCTCGYSEAVKEAREFMGGGDE